MTDFAAAQKRILERRAAREDALNAADTQHREERSAQLLRLPPALRSFAFESLAFWDDLRSPYGTQPAFRVGQVDAELLDEAMLGLLKNQAGEGLKLYGAHLKDDWNLEITAGLRAILWKLSVWDHGASYGASLQGLKYVDARSGFGPHIKQKGATKLQRLLHGLVTVGGRYAWSRWEERLSSWENGYDQPSQSTRRLGRLTTLLSTSHNIAAFASFLVFLHNGRYRTLLDRFLQLRLVASSNQTSREVSFEFLNRQLVWHAFTEFLLFLLPLVGISRWKRWVSRAWKKTRESVARLRSGMSAQQEEAGGAEVKRGELSFLPERTCAICYQDQNPAGGQSEQELISAAASSGGVIGSAMTDVTNPYETIPCGCVYCFVCLAQRIEAEEGEGWTCLRCGGVVRECRPWDGDVEEGTLWLEEDERTKQNGAAVVPNGAPLLPNGTRHQHHDIPPGTPGTLNRRKSVTFDLKDEEKSTEDYEQSSESDGTGLLGSGGSGGQSFDWSMIDDQPLEEY